jgi:hypothetical protein
MSTTTFPDGSQMVSTAIDIPTIETNFQYIAAQMLGYFTDPRTYMVTQQTGQTTIPIDSTVGLYPGLLIAGVGIPVGTLVVSFDSTAGTVTLSNACTATAAGPSPATLTDPEVWLKARIGWQIQGQPGPRLDIDNVTVKCVPEDTEYSRMHDVFYSTSEDGNYDIQTDVYTRAWRVHFVFYGPNALDHARAIRSYFVTVQPFYDFFAKLNLYINPDIKVPSRGPEVFQGQWWDRVDFDLELNEQVTETYTIGIVKSVEVEIFTKDGQVADFTVTT